MLEVETTLMHKQVLDIIASRHGESSASGSAESLLQKSELEVVKKFLIQTKPQQFESVDSLKKLYPYVLSSLLYSKGLDTSRVMASDTFSIWLVRCTQLNKLSEEVSESLNVISRENLNELFEYISDFLQEGLNPLANSLTSLLSKLIQYVKSFRAWEDWFEIITYWIDKSMELSLTSKNTYFLVETLVKELPQSDSIYVKHPQFVRNCINIMWSNALANSASKAFVSIFQNHTFHNEKKVEKWVNLWNNLITDGLLNSKLRKNILIYLMPQLFNCYPNSYNCFITKNFKIDPSKLSETDIEIITGLIQIGMNLSVISNPFSDSTSDLSIIPSSTLLQFLTHQNEKFRLSAFSILIGSNKSSQIVPRFIYDIIVNYSVIEIFLKESESIEIRNDFVSLLRHFIIRINDSCLSISKTKDKNQDKLTLIDSGRIFLEHVLKVITMSIRPASSYCQLALSLQLLNVFVELGLDGKDRSDQKIKTVKARKRKENNTDNSKIRPITVNIYTPELIQLLFNNITNNYEDIRNSSALLLLDCPHEKLLTTIGDENQIESIIEKSLNILYDLKGRKSEGGAKIFQFFTQLYESTGQYDKLNSILNLLIEKLDSGIKLLESNTSSLTKPERVHGIFTAIRLILENVDISQCYSEESFKLKVFEMIIEKVLILWDITKPTLSNSKDSASNNGVDAEEEEFSMTSEDRIRLRFSWKAVKESTTLLGTILQACFCSKSNSTKLADNFFIKSANIIMDQLSSVSHRGAFSSIYPTFVSVCEIFLRTDSLKNYPSSWLISSIELIQSKSQYISRRSGGLPYLITGVLTAEKVMGESLSSSMDMTFKNLLHIAQLEYIPNADEKMDIPQVHAFNCMKHIFIDSQLANRSNVYVKEALKLTLFNFNNATWAIRNCAMMLFTALQNRVFGTKKLGDFLPSTPARSFFAKYDGVDNILYDLLHEAVNNNNGKSNKFEVIFPILTIISRLESSGTDETSRFENLLMNNCLGNNYWKVREMAARLLASILHPNALLNAARKLMSECEDSCKSFNKAHGNLLAILEIIRRIKTRLPNHCVDSDFKGQICSKVTLFLMYLTTFSWVTSKTYVEILHELSEDSEPERMPHVLLNIIGNFIIGSLLSANAHDRLNGSRRLTLSSLTSVLLNGYKKMNMCDEIIDLIALLFSCVDEYEVQLVAINFCNENIDMLINNCKTPTLMDELWNLVNNKDCWSHIRSHALGLVQVFSTKNISFQKHENAIDTLYSFTSKAYSEDVNSRALDALGPVVAQMGSENTNQFLDLCENFIEDSTPFTIRYSAVHAITQFGVISIKQGKLNLYSARAICIIHNSLSDDDEDIRNIAADSYRLIFETPYKQVPSIISNLLSTTFLELFPSDITERVLVDYFIRSKPEISYRITETDLQTDDLPFDVESLNLYRDDISKRLQIIRSIIKVNNISPLSAQSLNALKTKILNDLDLIYLFAIKRGMDGYVGWSKDDFIFTSTTETVLDAKMFLNLTDDIDVVTKLEHVMNLLKLHDLNLSIKRLTNSCK